MTAISTLFGGFAGFWTALIAWAAFGASVQTSLTLYLCTACGMTVVLTAISCVTHASNTARASLKTGVRPLASQS